MDPRNLKADGNAERVTETQEFSSGPTSDSSRDFQLDSRLHVSSPSEVVRSEIMNAFELTEGDPAVARISLALRVIDANQGPRNTAVEEALSSLFANPQALPVVRQRLDAHDSGDFTIRSSNGKIFFVITEIAKGGFGTAYLVEDPSFPPTERRHTQVVKQLTKIPVEPNRQKGLWVPAGPDPEKHVARFNREASIAHDLTERKMGMMSPKYVGSGERVIPSESGSVLHPYIQYEFVHSLSIEQLRAAHSGNLSLAAFRDFAPHVAATMHAFHEAGYIHRDVKPGNFLVRSDGNAVMIIDFGLAKKRGEDAYDPVNTETNLTRSHATFGTVQTMAPEQWGGAANVTPAADWYAVYCVLYHTLTGRHVFQGDKTATLFNAHLNEKPTEALEALRSIGVDAEVVRLFEHGLAKNPLDRPSGAEAVDVLLRHSGYAGMSSGEFVTSVKNGGSPLRIPEDVRRRASDSGAPFLSGYPDTEGDRGASKMFEAIQDAYPDAVVAKTRSRLRQLFVPAGVLATGIVITAAGIALVRHGTPGSDAPVSGAVEPVTPVRESVPPPVPEFASSELFEGVTDNGRLTAIRLLKGTPAEHVLKLSECQVHRSNGRIHAVTMHLPEDMLARYVGVGVDSLPPAIREKHGTIARLIMKPDTHQYVLAVDQYGIAMSHGDEFNVFCEEENAAKIRKNLHLKQGDAKYEDCLADQDFLDVTGSFPSVLDDSTPELRKDGQDILTIIGGWKQAIESRKGAK